jgi:hypothetical protein
MRPKKRAIGRVSRLIEKRSAAWGRDVNAIA